MNDVWVGIAQYSELKLMCNVDSALQQTLQKTTE
jgi:hypothetical protein